MALVGSFVLLPPIIFPLIVALIVKNKLLQSEAAKVINAMNIGESIAKEGSQLFEISEKNHPDWTGDIGEIEQDGFTMREIETYRAISELIIDDRTILSDLEACFATPKKYFNKNIEKYSNRAIFEEATKDTIIWIGIVDELIDGDLAVELDWKEAKEEFLEQMKDLASKYHLEVWEDLLEESKDIPTWCEILDEKWVEKNFCVGAIDIDSDSYVLFICKREVLQRLSSLSKRLNHRIDFAKNM